jgi:transposase
MATTSNTPRGRQSSATRKTTAARKPAASTTTSTQPKTPVEQVQELAERAVLVPVGASLVARDSLVTSVKGLATKYRTRTGFERELRRYERRGATARNRLERQMRRTRTRVERELRQRRGRVERTVRQNRRRLEREVRAVRKDFERQSGVVTARVEKLVQGRLES